MYVGCLSVRVYGMAFCVCMWGVFLCMYVGDFLCVYVGWLFFFCVILLKRLYPEVASLGVWELKDLWVVCSVPCSQQN